MNDDVCICSHSIHDHASTGDYECCACLCPEFNASDACFVCGSDVCTCAPDDDEPEAVDEWLGRDNANS